MSLESVGNWSGNILDIGPLYPMVGSEGVLAILGVIFWVGWHVWQARLEAINYSDDMQTLKENGNMSRALNGERVLRAM